MGDSGGRCREPKTGRGTGDGGSTAAGVQPMPPETDDRGGGAAFCVRQHLLNCARAWFLITSPDSSKARPARAYQLTAKGGVHTHLRGRKGSGALTGGERGSNESSRHVRKQWLRGVSGPPQPWVNAFVKGGARRNEEVIGDRGGLIRHPGGGGAIDHRGYSVGTERRATKQGDTLSYYHSVLRKASAGGTRAGGAILSLE